MSVIKPGWVRVTADDLSEFHRRLITAIPKYASIAVSEMMLPATADVLPYEERLLLAQKPESITHKYDVFGAALANSPAFRQMLQKQQLATVIKNAPANSDEERAATTEFMRAFPGHKVPLRPTQRWSSPALSFGGIAGESNCFSFAPQCYFRADRVEISDSLCGEGTEVCRMLVGGRVQRVLIGEYMRTSEAAPGLLDVLLDTCQPGLSIGIYVRFLENCEFHMQLSGKAVT
jgi:hypothetical protein